MIDGRDIRTLDLVHTIVVGLVPQEPFLSPALCRITFVSKHVPVLAATAHRSWRLLLTSPTALDTDVESAVNLDGATTTGRVGACLAQSAYDLVLDEATASVDPYRGANPGRIGA